MHWEDLEGSGREGGGRGERDGEHMQTHGCFISMYDKIHYNKKKKYHDDKDLGQDASYCNIPCEISNREHSVDNLSLNFYLM